jgi:uncharacterized protein
MASHRVRLPLLLMAALIWAGSISTPELKGRVNDLAGVLSPADVGRISGMLEGYERGTTHQLAVLIVPTLAGEAMESFSGRVFDAWKLGRRGVDNGMLVTLAIAERAARIDLGSGFEPHISDAKAREIMNESMIPSFARGEFAQGIERGLERLMDEGRKLVAPISR